MGSYLMLHNSILDAIGHTPIVRLAQFSEDLGIEVYAKLESLNPGGSHKARIALGMILDAERRGVLIRDSGQTIIEPSGGNTGIGLVMAGNVLGYKVVLVIPDNYSPEKQKLLRLYGAKVVLSDSRLGNNSHGEKCMELQLENPSFVMLNQHATAPTRRPIATPLRGKSSAPLVNAAWTISSAASAPAAISLASAKRSKPPGRPSA